MCLLPPRLLSEGRCHAALFAAPLRTHPATLAPRLPTCLPQGLWRGTVPGQLLTIPYTAVQFVTLHQCKHMAEQLGVARRHPEWAPAVSFVSGALAGAAGTVASYPFDLLRTTLAAQGEPKVYASMTDAARGIVRQHGVQGLYRCAHAVGAAGYSCSHSAAGGLRKQHYFLF